MEADAGKACGGASGTATADSGASGTATTTVPGALAPCSSRGVGSGTTADHTARIEDDVASEILNYIDQINWPRQKRASTVGEGRCLGAPKNA